MTTTHSEHTRRRHVTNYTELWLIGTADEIAVLTQLAKNSGTLIQRSAPTPMGGTDPRQRVYLRLLFPH